jgi:predicted transposase YbfD/YdcC
VLAAVKPAAFQECFAKWIAQLQSTHASPDPAAIKQIAIDGKALRRSHDQRKKLGPLFLVSAWSVECGISLGQLATEEKSNEITAIPALLAKLEVQGAIVTIDAAGCQKNIAQQIIDGGGDYVLALKGNQGNIHKDTETWVLEQMANDFSEVTACKLEVTEKSHGREVTYWYVQLPVPESLRGREQWAKLQTIGVAVRHCREREKDTYDTRYYLASLPLGVQRFAQVVRGHWAIENTLHWCLDVTFREDESRLRNRIAGDNVAWLKRFAIGLLKQVPSKESIAMRRRMAGWNEDFLAQVLAGAAT